MTELEYFNRCLIQLKNQNSSLSNDEIMEMAHEQTDNWVYRNTGEIKVDGLIEAGIAEDVCKK